MEQYIGVKLVSAEPEDKLISEKNLGNGTGVQRTFEEGYKVVYEDGYTSWSPKDVFEKAYIKYQPYTNITVDGIRPEYQIRVITEAVELQSKIDKLNTFIKDNVTFQLSSNEEQLRLKQQLLAMQYYVTILSQRINNF